MLSSHDEKPVQKTAHARPIYYTQLYAFDRVERGRDTTVKGEFSSWTNNNIGAILRATATTARHAMPSLISRTRCICPTLQETSFGKGESAVLTETTLIHLRQYAASCRFCFVLYMVLIRYPLSTRPFDRLLRGQQGFDWRNKVVVSQESNHLKVHVAAHYDDIVRSDPIFLLINDKHAKGRWAQLGQYLPIEVNSKHGTIPKILTWLNHCVEGHSNCSTPEEPFLPTRVIEILTTSKPYKLRLLETNRKQGRYCALSHCWGSDYQPLQTTSSTLVDMQASIPWNWLPQTFRHAVHVTAKLGITYLWIDSLCIVQDDSADWAAEAGKMAGVYSEAFLVLAASSARDGSFGLFHDRDIAPCVKLSGISNVAQLSRKVVPWPSVFARRRQSHSSFRLFPSVDRRSEPLLTRGWAFQERMLARRVLYFASTELVWECRSCMTCECSGYNLPIDNRAAIFAGGSDDEHSDDDQRHSLSTWTLIVNCYSALTLRYEEDRLFALAGITERFARPSLGRNLAGLWETWLIPSLLWVRAGGRAERFRYYLAAPSWSWASIMDPVDYRFASDTLVTAICSVVDADYHSATSRRGRLITQGHITLKTSIAPLLLVHNGADIDDATELICSPVIKDLSNTFLDVELYQGIDRCPSGSPLMCVAVGESASNRGTVNALILRPSGSATHPGSFSRVGVAAGVAKSLFQVQEDPLTII